MNDSELAVEYELIVSKLRYQQQTKTYGGRSALEFARYCSKESTIALMYGLTDDAEYLMDIMDAALLASKEGDTA